MDFSFTAFHREQTVLRLIADDGDGLPSPGDRFIEIWSGKDAETPAVEVELERFYHRQFQQLTQRALKHPQGAYPLGAQMAYAGAEVQRRFVAYMAQRPFSAGGWVALERSAKARGNLELGHALNRALQQRPVLKQGYQLPFRDAWGDLLYLESGNSSVQIWLRTRDIGLSLKERQELAEILGYFVSVELDPKVDPKDLLRIGRMAREYYQQGLPLPPRLRIFRPIPSGPNQTPGGFYQAKTDTLSLPADSGPDSWAHEWSHFLLDLLDDQNGPNNTSFEAKNNFNELIFDPKKCSTWESLSIYAGTCDLERGQTAMAGSKKSAEDPAETLASVLEARRAEVLPSTLHLNLVEIHFLEKLRSVQYYLEAETIARRDLSELLKVAWKFHSYLGGDIPAPPRLGSKTELRTNLIALADWVQRLETEILPQAKAQRRVKIQWAEGLLTALRPQDPGRGAPDPTRAPWRTVE